MSGIKSVEPENKFSRLSGAFELDEQAIKRIVKAMERHVPETAESWAGITKTRSVLYELEFSDGRKEQTSDVADLEHFSFHSPRRASFKIVTETGSVSVSVTFSYLNYQPAAFLSVFRVANIDSAVKDVVAAVESTKPWYSVPYQNVSVWVQWLVVIAFVVSSIDMFVLRSGFVPHWLTAVVAVAGVAILISRILLFDRIAIQFGGERSRLELRRKVRRWVPAAVGAIVLAVIGSGALFNN
ncbi:MAG: hypothetical protein JNM47_03955 [Hyphomonadaceae bacterium]|nr:hypothetical protein [Hyphomonadaceae bacterium]